MEESKPKNHPMLFMLLIEAAMRHREAFFREEMDAYRTGMRTAFDSVSGQFKTMKELKKHKSAMNREIAENDTREMKFNGMIYHKIDQVERTLSPDVRTSFDNLATAFSIMAENLIEARNSTELLTVMRLYTEGYFDTLLAEHFGKDKQKELNDKYEVAKDHHHTDLPDTRNAWEM